MSSLDAIRIARDREQEAAKEYRRRWTTIVSIPYKVDVSNLIHDAIADGHSRKKILKALGTTNYQTLYDYMALTDRDIERARTKEVDLVTFDDDGTARIGGHKFHKDENGLWEPVDIDNEDAWILLNRLPL